MYIRCKLVKMGEGRFRPGGHRGAFKSQTQRVHGAAGQLQYSGMGDL